MSRSGVNRRVTEEDLAVSKLANQPDLRSKQTRRAFVCQTSRSRRLNMNERMLSFSSASNIRSKHRQHPPPRRRVQAFDMNHGSSCSPDSAFPPTPILETLTEGGVLTATNSEWLTFLGRRAPPPWRVKLPRIDFARGSGASRALPRALLIIAPRTRFVLRRPRPATLARGL